MPGPQPTANTSPTEEERRRSHRVYLLIPLEMAWTTKEDVHLQEHAETEQVSAHGATLWLKKHPPARTPVELTNGHTGKSTSARVVARCKHGLAGYAQIAVELTVPSYAFWSISFPPAPSTPPD